MNKSLPKPHKPRKCKLNKSPKRALSSHNRLHSISYTSLSKSTPLSVYKSPFQSKYLTSTPYSTTHCSFVSNLCPPHSIGQHKLSLQSLPTQFSIRKQHLSTTPNPFATDSQISSTPLTIPLSSLSAQPASIPSHIAKQNKYIKSSKAFHPTEPAQFIGRILLVAGVASALLGAKYLATAIKAGATAYQNTSQNLKPLSDEDLLLAHDEIVSAADGVMEQAERDAEIKQKKQREKEKREKERAIQKKKEELGLDNNPSKPKFHQDDFSAHIDSAAIKRRKNEQKAEEQRELDQERYISNEQEIELNAVVEKWEFAMCGSGAGFKEIMDLIEAEAILDLVQGACIEELRDQRGLMLKMNHPDHGGSPFMTQKINEAFDLLSIGARSDPNYVHAKEQQKKEDFERMKEKLLEIQREHLRKEGLLDENGELKHPDGSPQKKQ